MAVMNITTKKKTANLKDISDDDHEDLVDDCSLIE